MENSLVLLKNSALTDVDTHTHTSKKVTTMQYIYPTGFKSYLKFVSSKINF
jgi:hypothetical protein